ncbi:Prephenate dehydratase [Leucosporidium creatinivorum]|uniref:Prephenate dehydratase n=1 Tax=Leucosporidium creatinivorum TaxID=106004 RepID=A0A1Y2G2G2_9BASI|nr:Prephenate dehydratase [Leucosporidium creatinivorum]
MSSSTLRVAFLGPLGTYSHQATNNFFGDCSLVPCDRIVDVFTSVSSSSTPFGIVPIENSSIGDVKETMDALRATTLCVRGMTSLKIGHALLGLEVGMRQELVKRVYSHEQGLGQCVEYLALRYPGAQIIPVNSTAKAAQEAAEDEEALAICSIKCAEVYGLEVVDTDIQDGGETNTTRFVVISQASTPLPDEFPIVSNTKVSNGYP